MDVSIYYEHIIYWRPKSRNNFANLEKFDRKKLTLHLPLQLYSAWKPKISTSILMVAINTDQPSNRNIFFCSWLLFFCSFERKEKKIKLIVRAFISSSTFNTKTDLVYSISTKISIIYSFSDDFLRASQK